MKLAKTTLFSAIITFIRISSGFVAGKAVAAVTGPAGVALVGQFTNFIAIVLTFSNGAISNGVIKYSAENDSKGIEQKSLFSTAFRISIVCSLSVGIILFLFAGTISEWIFKDGSYHLLIRVFALSVLLYSINSLLISILNGLKQIKVYTLVNTLGSFVGLAMTLILVFYFKLTGALYALVLSQSVVCLITCVLLRKTNWFSWSNFGGKLDPKLAKKLSHYSIMALVSLITMPVAQLLIRDYIVKNIGIDDAGFWQAMMRISDGYLMLITTALSTYYLPKLSSLHTDAELRSEVINGYKIIIPTLIISILIIYFLRVLIIQVLFTEGFLAVQHLFFYQLLGDMFKMTAWILSYLMLAKSMIKAYIVTELFFGISYVGLSMFFISQKGLEGVVIAFAVNYFMYMICMIVLFRKLLMGKKLSL